MNNSEQDHQKPKDELELPVFTPEGRTGKVRPGKIIAILGVVFLVLAFMIVTPGTFRSRMSAYEAAAQGTCKTIAGAQMDYANNSRQHFATSLEDLHTGRGANGMSYLPGSIRKGQKSGYTYHLEVGEPRTEGGVTSYWAWSAAAWPVGYKSTGVRSFYIDETGIVRGQDVKGTRGSFRMRAIH